MTKKIVFEIYHEVKKIIEQAYLEEEMLYKDAEYQKNIRIILYNIMDITCNKDLLVVSNLVNTIRNEYSKYSYGYKIFNSILDVIFENSENI